MSALCLIPARGGSKGLPGKNLLRIDGVSLVARAVVTARKFVERGRVSDALIVVDTDSEAIAAEGRAFGAMVPFLRPPSLAQDGTPMIANTLAALDRLEEMGYTVDAVILLQPTSPTRTVDDIEACWSVFDGAAHSSVASVSKGAHALELSMRRDDDGKLSWAIAERIGNPGREQFPETVWPSGSVYINSPDSLRTHRAFLVPGHTIGVELPVDHSVDVDSAVDVTMAEALLARVPAAQVRLADRVIGCSHPCLVVADLLGSPARPPSDVHRAIDNAAETGADALKLDGLSLVQVGERAVSHALSRGLLLLSTPTDEAAVDRLGAIGISAFALDAESSARQLLSYVAGKGKPILLSTSNVSLPELVDAVAVVWRNGNPPLALLQRSGELGVSATAEALRSITTLRQLFGCPVGWKDVCRSNAVSMAAVTMGASVVERTLVDTNASVCRSSPLKGLVESVRVLNAVLGSSGVGRA